MSKTKTQTMARPNFIVILTDDLGYNDLGCFNSTCIKTPRIDRMAGEGLKLTSFYAGAPLCSPSRASLLTGCYPPRVAERYGKKHLHTILDSSEILLPEILKETGYVTAAIGKWHLAGCRADAISTDPTHGNLSRYGMCDPSMMPRQKGFDSYFGIPYSNDMDPVVLMRDNAFVEYLGQTEKQAGLTTRYTDEALGFIEKHAHAPFFLYLAHNMPHTPLYPNEKFAGKSDNGFYGDCVEEIDWNTGRILDKLKELGIDDKTFVIFTFDNGPWIVQDVQGRNPDAITSRLQSGRADPLRGFKMTTWEGGPRVPCVMWWPSVIPGGRASDELVTAMDIYTTFADLAGARIPDNRIIDGLQMMPLLSGTTAVSPRECYYFYQFTHLHGVRSGSWKLLLPRSARPPELGWYGDMLHEEINEITLFDLETDIGETRNLADQHPDIVSRLMDLIESARKDLGDKDGPGRGMRTIGSGVNRK